MRPAVVRLRSTAHRNVTNASALEERFRARLAEARWPSEAPTAIVGVSGGLDSMTLLRLLVRYREHAGRPRIVAAHLDHRMSSDSAASAEWVAATCDEWGVPCLVRAAPAPVRSEAEGRALRYRFFEDAMQRVERGAVVATAHTADDQAETVLFRIARGAGPKGMAGVLPERPPGLVRPLLPFWRRELAAFAAAQDIPFRDDPTNQDLRWTRNRLRHDLLPALEEAVPGAAAALAALADTSRSHVEALNHLLDDRIEALAPGGERPSYDVLDLDRDGLLTLPDSVLALVLRRAASRLGGRPGRNATHELLRFARESPSGRRTAVAGGVAVTRRLAHLRFERTEPADGANENDARASLCPAAQEIIVTGGEGAGRFAHGRLEVHAAWSHAPPDGFPSVAPFAPGDVQFPLAVRPWRPGDRIAAPYGKKKVNKILLEARIPSDCRTGYPVLTDAAGKVLWVPGLAPPTSGCTDAPSPTTGCTDGPSPAAGVAPAPLCWVAVRVDGLDPGLDHAAGTAPAHP